MKRFFALLLTVMLVPLAALGEALSLPVFTADYGLNEYYEELKEANGGLFRFWSPEAKAALHDAVPTLCAMEEERIHTYHEGWLPDCSLLATAYAQAYICPDDTMIPRDTAVEMAAQWAVKQQLISEEEMDDYLVSVSCIRHEEDAEWVIGFYRRVTCLADVHMNACTGEFPQMDGLQAKQKVLDYSAQVGAPWDFPLSDRHLASWYDYTLHTWCLHFFIADMNDVGLTYYLNDTTGEVLPGSNG